MNTKREEKSKCILFQRYTILKIKETDRLFILSVQIAHSQGTLLLQDEDVVMGSLSLTESSQAGEEFTIGGVVAKSLRLEILNKPAYVGYDFTGAVVTPIVSLDVT